MPTRRDLGAAAVLAAHALLLLLGPPILDYLQGNPSRAWGPFVQLHELDRKIRAPITKALAPAEAVLGARQNWHFYTTGASRRRHFEIWVDGEFWHRSNDPDHAFMAGPLANSRVRHHVKDWVRGKREVAVQPALLNLVAMRVKAADPAAKKVKIRGLEGRWPTQKQKEVRSAEVDLTTGDAP